jgi:fucose permease
MNTPVASVTDTRQKLSIVACFATMFMLGVTISLLGPSLPALAERTGIALPQAGIFFTLFSGGSVLAILLVARFNDQPARHALLIGGALVMSGAFWLIANSRTFTQAAVAVALSGLAMSTVGTAPNAIITDLYRGRAGQALNALHTVVGVGSFVGPVMIAAAIRMGSDYRLAYRLAAAAMILVCALWAISRPPRPQRAAPGERRGLTSFIAPLILVFALAMLYTGTEQVLGGWLFTYARDSAALAAAVASLLVSLFWLAVLVGRLAAVRVLRRTTNAGLLRACVLMGAAGIGVILLGRAAPALLWIGVALAGFGFGPVFPTTLALSSELAPGHAGAMGSLVVASGSVGAMVLPFAAGALIPQIGIAGSIAATLLPLTAMLVCVGAISRAERATMR